MRVVCFSVIASRLRGWCCPSLDAHGCKDCCHWRLPLQRPDRAVFVPGYRSSLGGRRPTTKFWCRHDKLDPLPRWWKTPPRNVSQGVLSKASDNCHALRRMRRDMFRHCYGWQTTNCSPARPRPRSLSPFGQSFGQSMRAPNELHGASRAMPATDGMGASTKRKFW